MDNQQLKTFFLTFVAISKTYSFEDFSIIKKSTCIEINLSIFSGWFWTFFIVKNESMCFNGEICKTQKIEISKK